MKFVQLTENNMRNIFLEKSYTKYGEEASVSPFIKNQNWPLYLGQQCEMIKGRFYLSPSQGLPKYN